MLMAPSLLSPWPSFHSAGFTSNMWPNSSLHVFVLLGSTQKALTTRIHWAKSGLSSVRVLADPLCPPSFLPLSLSVSSSCSSAPTHVLDSHTCMSLPFCAVCVCSVESWIILLALNYLEGKWIECAAFGTSTPIVKNFPSGWPVCSGNLHL